MRRLQRLRRCEEDVACAFLAQLRVSGAKTSALMRCNQLPLPFEEELTSSICSSTNRPRALGSYDPIQADLRQLRNVEEVEICFEKELI